MVGGGRLGAGGRWGRDTFGKDILRALTPRQSFIRGTLGPQKPKKSILTLWDQFWNTCNHIQSYSY